MRGKASVKWGREKRGEMERMRQWKEVRSKPDYCSGTFVIKIGTILIFSYCAGTVELHIA